MIKNRRGVRGGVGAVLLLLFGQLACQPARGGEDPFQGTVEYEDRELAFEIAGTLTTLNVTRGQRVEAGTRLAALDDRLTTLARAARASELASAEAQLALLRSGSRSEDIRAMAARVRAATATEELLEKNLSRETALLRHGATTRALVDDLEGQLRRASAERQSIEQNLRALQRGARSEEIAGAQARVDAATAALKLEEARLERHLLNAPATGSVLDVHVESGEMVSAGVPIVTIADTTRPYAEVFVPIEQLGSVQVGKPARLRVDSESSWFEAVIEHVASETEFTPRYLFSERERPNLVVRVRVRIRDPEHRLHAGVPAFVSFEREHRP